MSFGAQAILNRVFAAPRLKCASDQLVLLKSSEGELGWLGTDAKMPAYLRLGELPVSHQQKKNLWLWFGAVVGTLLVRRYFQCVYLCCALLKFRAKFAVLRLKMFLLKLQFRKISVERGKLLLGQGQSFTKDFGKRNALNSVSKYVRETHKI